MISARHQDILSRMTVRTKVGQLLMAPLDEATLPAMIGRFHCGSLIVWTGVTDIQDPIVLRELANRAQAMSLEHRGVPLWLHGLAPGVGWRPGWLGRVARVAGTAEAQEIAALFGRRWRAVGLHNLPEPFLNVPLFDTGIMLRWVTARDPDVVARYGLALTRGLTSVRCGTMAQHFPAHGATPLDSHTAYPVVSLDRETLLRDHLESYRACFQAGCTTICTAHLACPCLDPDPHHIATTSRAILIDVLRGELGFRGVTIADAIEMKGFGKNGPPEVVVVDAINAGCDSICLCARGVDPVERVFDALLAAVESGRISPQRLDDAVVRHLVFLEWLGLLDGGVMVPAGEAEALLREEGDNRLLARLVESVS